MTRNTLSAIDLGEFEDAPWVSALLRRFADYYFAALETYERSLPDTPTVWLYAFNPAYLADAHPLQHLILGVNAHINYDLVFALEDLLAPEWLRLPSDRRRLRYRDHCHVNAIIAQTIDSVQDWVVERYTPAVGAVDAWMGRLDEWMISRLITAWRDQVWTSATRLVELPADSERQAFRWELERSSVHRARAILGESGLAGLAKLV